MIMERERGEKRKAYETALSWNAFCALCWGPINGWLDDIDSSIDQDGGLMTSILFRVVLRHPYLDMEGRDKDKTRPKINVVCVDIVRL